jgi:N-acetylglutamate synthase-like GNAT family acetyltransferase
MSDMVKLTPHPLRAGEREALKAALAKAELPTADIGEPGRLFWRFETRDEVPVGFGGLEVHGEDALMRSLVTLPPVRNRGVGTAMVAALEFEARLHGCRSVWLITTTAADFYQRLGYACCERAVMPPAIRASAEFSTLCPDSADVLMKQLT